MCKKKMISTRLSLRINGQILSVTYNELTMNQCIQLFPFQVIFFNKMTGKNIKDNVQKCRKLKKRWTKITRKANLIAFGQNTCQTNGAPRRKTYCKTYCKNIHDFAKHIENHINIYDFQHLRQKLYFFLDFFSFGIEI